MYSQKQNLTASNIKYLLVLNELNEDESGIHCVDVAKTMGITKPSVYAMMNTLKGMELIRKNKYGVIFFTQQGQNIANRYSKFFKILCIYFDEILPKDADIKSAACALLAELSINSLEAMCNKVNSKVQVNI